MDEALALLQEPGARALGGGTDLLPLVREALAEPDMLVDLRVFIYPPFHRCYYK